MHLLVGLGNPGKKYENNRHNVGFMAADFVANKHGISDFREKWTALHGRGTLFEDDAVVLKPQTFMNLSGDSVQPAASFLKVAPEQILVLHDELEIPFGDVRLKFGGGHAGHNGLRSMIARLGTADFGRIRIGVGRPPEDFKGDIADFVLSDFASAESVQLASIYEKVERAIARFIKDGPKAAAEPARGRKG